MSGDVQCWLCERPIGSRYELHHPVPKSRGGRETVPLHRRCHRTLHARFTNAELARTGANVEALREDAEIARFIRWVGDKPPDFHAPTRKPKR